MYKDTVPLRDYRGYIRFIQGLYRDTEGLGFPKIRGTFFGGSPIRTIVFGGLYLGPPYLGKLPSKDILLLSGSMSHRSCA